jgi:glycosyltransferase involved in cell wall biosynthesis
MHILYLVPHLPNPTKARSHYQIRGLVEAGHTVTVVSVIRKAVDIDHIAALRSNDIQVIAEPRSLPQIAAAAAGGFARGLPLQGRLMWSQRLAHRVDEALEAHPADIVHAEHVRMACYGLKLAHSHPVVWDAIDHLGSFFAQTGRTSASLIWRAAGMVEAPRLAAYERWLTSQFPLTLVIGARDLALFKRDNPCADRVVVAAPGLPIKPLPADQGRADDVLIFTGTMDYHPNVSSLLYFVSEVLPQIWRERPDVRLQIVGARPTAEIRRLASARIEVTGLVPSLDRYLQTATVALAPIRYAGGLQNKVIEAFLMQTPVVASSVAVDGLDVTHEREVMIADTPRDFASAVIRLLSDPDLRRRIGGAGRRYVEQRHDLRQTTQDLVELYALAQRRYRSEHETC